MKIPYLIIIIFITTNIFAINYYDSLNTDEQLLALDSVVTTYKIKNGYNGTIESCIKKDSPGTLPARLFNFSAWMIYKENSVEKTNKQLDKRVKTFFSLDTFSFSKSYISHAGEINSPINIIAYVSVSCPLCKRVIIPLYMAVTDGPLKGLATLEIRPISTGVGNKGLLAAEKLGKAWDYYLSFEEEDRRLTEKIVISHAKKTGMNHDSFTKMFWDDNLTKTLKEIRNEALTNGVSVTPTLFINKRRYQSYKDPQWIIDAVEFDLEQINQSTK